MGETQSFLSRRSQPREGGREEARRDTPMQSSSMDTELVSETEQGTRVTGLTPTQRPNQLLPQLPTHLAVWLHSDFPDMAIFRGGWEVSGILRGTQHVCASALGP